MEEENKRLVYGKIQSLNGDGFKIRDLPLRIIRNKIGSNSLSTGSPSSVFIVGTLHPLEYLPFNFSF